MDGYGALMKGQNSNLLVLRNCLLGLSGEDVIGKQICSLFVFDIHLLFTPQPCMVSKKPHTYPRVFFLGKLHASSAIA